MYAVCRNDIELISSQPCLRMSAKGGGGYGLMQTKADKGGESGKICRFMRTSCMDDAYEYRLCML